MPSIADAIEAVDQWYDALPIYQDNLPSKGSIAAALHVLQRLRSEFNPDIAAHVASGEAQIKGLSAKALKLVLNEFGETRILSSVGGRSNRGARKAVGSLLESIRRLQLSRLDEDTRRRILKAMQERIVSAHVPVFFSVKRVRASFNPAAPTARFIDAILKNAEANGKAGPVAEYLVGAKLACRFPGAAIRNKHFSTSDAQSDVPGDFKVGKTVFHVTITPMPELFEKIRRNLAEGHRVYLLVPRSKLAGAQQNAENLNVDIAVEAIESFVATNIDELCTFLNGEELKTGVRCLLDKYNQRVEAIETDKSMLIEVPPNL